MMLIKEFHNHAKWKRINIAIAMDSLSDPPCVLEILDFLTLKMFCLKPPRSSILRLQLHVRLRHGVDREWDKVNHRCLDLLETRNGLQFYPMVSDVFWCRGTLIYILNQGSDEFYPMPSDAHMQFWNIFIRRYPMFSDVEGPSFTSWNKDPMISIRRHPTDMLDPKKTRPWSKKNFIGSGACM